MNNIQGLIILLEDLPIFCIKSVVSDGNRVYILSNAEGGCVPCYGWVVLDFGDFKQETIRFTDVKNNRVPVILHHCPDLDAAARYVWQPRMHNPPDLPVQCPRCRYRLDYKKMEKK